MQETLLEILTYLRIVWRYRWMALITAFCVSTAGWIAVFTMPNIYESSTKVFLDTTSLLQPVLRGLTLNSNQRRDAVSMIQRTLKTRPNMESLARSTDMDLNANTPEELDAIISGLSKKIKVSGGLKGNIFNISYSNADPKLATRVVETLLNIFVERSLGESRKDTSKTREFLDQQIREYESKLEAAEDRLKVFKRKNLGMMPEGGQNYFARREQMKQTLQEARLALKEAVQRQDSIKAQLHGEKSFFDENSAYKPTFVSALDPRIKLMEDRLDDLLLKYTEQHPDVIAARDLLAAHHKNRTSEEEQYIQDQMALSESGDSSDGRMGNPVYQELKISLGDAKAEVAGLEARVGEYERREVELMKFVDTVLKVETELKSLNRDYQVDSKNYNALVGRREALKLGDEAEKTTDPVQFNIIEPPRIPSKPTSPNRPLLNAIVLLMGIGGGIALAWLYGMIRPSFYTKDQVSAFTDIPVLGSVIRIATPGDIFKRRMGYIGFAFGCALLVLAMGGVTLIESSHRESVTNILSGVM